MNDKAKENVTVFVFAVLSVFLTLLLFVARSVTGYYIESTEGGNCVVAKEFMRLDPEVYCSSDINEVKGALEQYRSMPLGWGPKAKERAP